MVTIITLLSIGVCVGGLNQVALSRRIRKLEERLGERT